MNEENTSAALAPVIIRPKDAPPRVRLFDLLGAKAYRFLKHHGILLAILFILTLWTWTVTAIAAHNARVDTEARLAEEYEARLAAYVTEWELSHTASLDEQMQAQIEADAAVLARVGMGVLNTYDRARLTDAGTQMQIVLNRVLAGGEFASVKSIADAAQASGAWIGYDPNGSVTEDVHTLALQMAAAYHRGEPMPCSSRYLWTEWDATDSELVARDQYMIDPSCHFWRWQG